MCGAFNLGFPTSILKPLLQHIRDIPLWTLFSEAVLGTHFAYMTHFSDANLWSLKSDFISLVLKMFIYLYLLERESESGRD